MEAAEKAVSCSFLCLGFVVSQSVMLVERLFVSRSRMHCRMERMCGCVCVVFDNNNNIIKKMFATTCGVHKPP